MTDIPFENDPALAIMKEVIAAYEEGVENTFTVGKISNRTFDIECAAALTKAREMGVVFPGDAA